VGAPRKYPEFVWALLADLLWVIGAGSTRKLMRELRRGGKWKSIRKRLKRWWPDLPVLPPDPPARQTFEYYLDRYFADTNETSERALEIHAEVAAKQAIEAGNFDLAGAGPTRIQQSSEPDMGTGRSSMPCTSRSAGRLE
jgi:hypothetical protein